MNRQQGIRNTQAMAQDRLGVMRLLFHGRFPPKFGPFKIDAQRFSSRPHFGGPFPGDPTAINRFNYRLSTIDTVGSGLYTH